VSTEQKENLDAILRQSAFPADMGVSELRRLLAEQAAAQPLPARDRGLYPQRYNRCAAEAATAPAAALAEVAEPP
jgi:hypothetical protein